MSFQQGLSGLSAAAKNLEVIGNNISNANTIGAKSSRAEFSDMYASAVGGSGGVGIGSRLAAVTQDHTQGSITTTGSNLDLAINGKGYFQVQDTSVSTGTADRAMATAIASSSNVANSLRAPPPRTSTTASRSVRRPNAVSARVICATAWSPCTRTSVICRWKPKPLRSISWRKSAQAALSMLVTTPTRSGAGDHETRRLASNNPVATSRRMTASRCMARSPSVNRGSMSTIFNPSRPPGA
jgi:hypothetical protein